eukprot:CAMPEP_0115758892 /NCGR_PEP_ID=MMETSP0272-20121206/99195_1 /TAXON_ID=71861 /ORGANISM="Scrippsiella trochoidea, Strain CCMP3099" /LENGTH=49 /DNA_ID=CAMNT_0003204495 /DNA_START=499 /DNA_END=648 /DNA_ORIENTATION=+
MPCERLVRCCERREPPTNLAGSRSTQGAKQGAYSANGVSIMIEDMLACS